MYFLRLSKFRIYDFMVCLFHTKQQSQEVFCFFIAEKTGIFSNLDCSEE